MAKESIQIRIDPALLVWIDQESEANERSRSWMINHFLGLQREQALGRQRHAEANSRNC